jgi:hypothetical protein
MYYILKYVIFSPLLWISKWTTIILNLNILNFLLHEFQHKYILIEKGTKPLFKNAMHCKSLGAGPGTTFIWLIKCRIRFLLNLYCFTWIIFGLLWVRCDKYASGEATQVECEAYSTLRESNDTWVRDHFYRVLFNLHLTLFRVAVSRRDQFYFDAV